MYFHLRPQEAVLSDANFELINTYRTVTTDVDALIDKLSEYQRRKLTEKFYYRERDKGPSSLSDVDRAARFIFLNKTCFNGLYRVNREGKFNVPFGKYDRMPTLYSASNLKVVSNLLRTAKVEPGYCLPILEEFEPTEGDFVYLDPPYATENSNGFTGYTKEAFTWLDQQRLAKEFVKLARNGCYVMMSNGGDRSIKDLYSNAAKAIIPIKVDRMINSRGDQRTGYSELLILSYVPENQTLEAWTKD